MTERAIALNGCTDDERKLTGNILGRRYVSETRHIGASSRDMQDINKRCLELRNHRERQNVAKSSGGPPINDTHCSGIDQR